MAKQKRRDELDAEEWKAAEEKLLKYRYGIDYYVIHGPSKRLD
jgi:hypothetical protein